MILRLISDPEIDQRSCSFGKLNDGSGATPKWGIHMSQLTSSTAATRGSSYKNPID
jgi:hypothetical protein